eukprot:1157397-Pelagomonas_calceolata.AAC.3
MHRDTALLQVQQLRDVPLPEEEGANQEEDLEVSDEDLEFVREHGESIGFLKELNKAELDKSVKGSQKKDAARAQKGGAAAAAAAAAKAKEEEPGEEEEEEEEEEGLEAYERGPRRVAKVRLRWDTGLLKDSCILLHPSIHSSIQSTHFIYAAQSVPFNPCYTIYRLPNARLWLSFNASPAQNGARLVLASSPFFGTSERSGSWQLQPAPCGNGPFCWMNALLVYAARVGPRLDTHVQCYQEGNGPVC